MRYSLSVQHKQSLIDPEDVISATKPNRFSDRGTEFFLRWKWDIKGASVG